MTGTSATAPSLDASALAPALAPAPVGVRIKLASLWTSMLFVFAYVDLFGLYRADVLAGLEAGQISGITVGQGFLLFTTAYIVVPSLMVAGSVLLPARAGRLLALALAVVYALTIIGSCFGESNLYYLFGSAVEVVLLAVIARVAWAWPRA